MGVSRSYEALAKRYGCSKKSVTKRAVKERWQERARELETNAVRESEKRVGESVGAARERHERIAKIILAKAVEALKGATIPSGLGAIRAVEAALRLERELGLGIGDGEQADGGTSARGGVPTTAFKRLMQQAPMWIIQILGRVAHWGAQEGERSNLIVRLIGEICSWLDEVTADEELSPVIAFHQQILIALQVDQDPIRTEEIRAKLQRLYRELQAHRRDQTIEVDDAWQWRSMGIELPRSLDSSPGIRSTITWRQAFGCDADDPFEFVVKHIDTPVLAVGAEDE